MVDVISDSSIQVQWGPPERSNGILTYYVVAVFNQLTEYHYSIHVNASDADVIVVHGLSTSVIYTLAQINVKFTFL